MHLMRILRSLITITLFSFLQSTFAQASPPVQVVVIAYGLFEALGDQNDREVVSTAAGRVTTHDSSRHLETTDSLKARRGVTFGLKYQIRGLPDGEHEGFSMRAVHPPMTGPSGRATTVSEANITVFSEAGVAEDDLFYSLSKDYEVLPGEWKLEVLYRGQVILSKKFTLT